MDTEAETDGKKTTNKDGAGPLETLSHGILEDIVPRSKDDLDMKIQQGEVKEDLADDIAESNEGNCMNETMVAGLYEEVLEGGSSAFYSEQKDPNENTNTLVISYHFIKIFIHNP